MVSNKLLDDIVLPDSIRHPELCDFCGKPLPRRFVTHHNISQAPAEHKFCSKNCKEKWCHKQSC